MKTRNSGTPKAGAGKKTPPVKKSPAAKVTAPKPAAATPASAKKTPPVKKKAASSTVASPEPKTEPAAPKPSETKCTPRAKQVKDKETTPSPSLESKPTPTSDSIPTPAIAAKPTPSTDTKPIPTTDTKPKPSTDSKPVNDSKPPPSTDPKPTPSSDSKPAASSGSKTTPSTDTKTTAKPETAEAQAKEGSGDAQAAPQPKVLRTKTVVRRVVKKKVPKSSNSASVKSPKSEEAVKPKVEESSKKEDGQVVKDVEAEVGESANKGQSSVKVEDSPIDNAELEELSVMKVEEPMDFDEQNIVAQETIVKEGIIEEIENERDKEKLGMNDMVKEENKTESEIDTEENKAEVDKDKEEITSENEIDKDEDKTVSDKGKEGNMIENEEDKEDKEANKTGNGMGKEEINVEAEHMEEDVGHLNTGVEDIDAKSEEEMCNEMEEHGGDQVVLEASDEDDLSEDDDEPVEEETAVNNVTEPGEDKMGGNNVAEPGEEAEQLKEEQRELKAHAKERNMRKELEIFVNRLGRDVKEGDVKRAFEKVGEVVEVKLHKEASNKNKGYAVVKFATKEQAKRALSEVKNPTICGKRCETAPSDDDTTLFLGNICNTWTKEAIKQKLKDYGVGGVVNITLVADPRHEGKSRGFAFIEFRCHADAKIAFKRLQKPDVLFGHAERTAKVAFAAPIREPDPEVMAQVKSVFVDGLPATWDEERVKDHFKVYGEIEKISLARNMPKAKRDDYAFVDFSTHEAALACIDGINKTELVNGKSKVRVKVRLSNPQPKTQAVKGGISGGYLIGQGSGSSHRQGRSSARGQPSSRASIQHERGLHPHGRAQTGRMVSELDYPYAEFRSRDYLRQGRRAPAVPSRYDLGGPSRGMADMENRRLFSSRVPPFSPEGGFSRSYPDRRFDEPYFYEDMPRGTKRPFITTDPGYMEPSRLRPRLGYSDPPSSSRETHYLDTQRMGGGMYSRDYHGSDYGGAPPSYYGADRPYRRGYY